MRLDPAITRQFYFGDLFFSEDYVIRRSGRTYGA
jgi:hypothetical protein